VEASFEGQIAMLLAMESILDNRMGRRSIKGIPVISGGLLGQNGDLVVDDITHPTQIYGVADGCGDFKRELTAEEIRKRDALKQYISAGAKNED
jgi:hypothetical protein